jgi:hypothetical protein
VPPPGVGPNRHHDGDETSGDGQVDCGDEDDSGFFDHVSHFPFPFSFLSRQHGDDDSSDHGQRNYEHDDEDRFFH